MENSLIIRGNEGYLATYLQIISFKQIRATQVKIILPCVGVSIISNPADFVKQPAVVESMTHDVFNLRKKLR